MCFGELLIDFVPTVNGVSLAEAPAFKKAPGGAPANVAVGIARLGGSSAFIGKVNICSCPVNPDFNRTTEITSMCKYTFLFETWQRKIHGVYVVSIFIFLHSCTYLQSNQVVLSLHYACIYIPDVSLLLILFILKIDQSLVYLHCLFFIFSCFYSYLTLVGW